MHHFRWMHSTCLRLERGQERNLQPHTVNANYRRAFSRSRSMDIFQAHPTRTLAVAPFMTVQLGECLVRWISVVKNSARFGAEAQIQTQLLVRYAVY